MIHLFQAAQEHPLEMFVHLALATGMRTGELLALQWSDIDFERDVLTCARTLLLLAPPVIKAPKTKQSQRLVPVPALVMEMLLRHRQDQQEQRACAGEQWQNHNLVFCTATGHFLTPKNLLDDFHSLLTDAGLPNIRLHDLRQTARHEAQKARNQQ